MLKQKVFDRGTEIVLTFEHSLLSLSKWEARTHQPYLTRGPKSSGDMIDYYRDMLTSPEHDPDLVYRLSPDQMDEITRYINDSQTASTVDQDDTGKKPRETVTSETLYMQMVVLEIPFEAETWHLNRLMMLIAKVSNAKAPDKKEKDKGKMLTAWDAMNRRNRERYNSKG